MLEEQPVDQMSNGHEEEVDGPGEEQEEKQEETIGPQLLEFHGRPSDKRPARIRCRPGAVRDQVEEGQGDVDVHRGLEKGGHSGDGPGCDGSTANAPRT